VWPGEAALDDRVVAALSTEPCSVWRGKLRFDPALADKSATKVSGSNTSRAAGVFETVTNELICRAFSRRAPVCALVARRVMRGAVDPLLTI
jgi:hypothetical protein